MAHGARMRLWRSARAEQAVEQAPVGAPEADDELDDWPVVRSHKPAGQWGAKRADLLARASLFAGLAR